MRGQRSHCATEHAEDREHHRTLHPDRLDRLPGDARAIDFIQDSLPLTVILPPRVTFTLDRHGNVFAEGFRLGNLKQDALTLDPEYATWS